MSGPAPAPLSDTSRVYSASILVRQAQEYTLWEHYRPLSLSRGLREKRRLTEMSAVALQPLDGVSKLLHGLGHQLAGATHIEAHIAFAARAEHLAIIERQVSLVDKEVVELLMVESQVVAVKPDEEGSLWPQGLGHRQLGHPLSIHLPAHSINQK